MAEIWIDTSVAEGSQTCGMGEYAKNLINMLEENGNVVKCFSNPFVNMGIFSTKIYFLWLNSFFLLKTMICKPDIVIFPAYIMPFFVRRKSRYYVVFYDIMLAREQFFGKRNAKTFNLFLSIAAKKATKIITISDTTKTLLNKEFNIPLEKINIINCTLKKPMLNIVNFNFKTLEQKYNLKRQKYILFIGGCFKHKNVDSLMKAFSTISIKYNDFKLVIAGYKGLVSLCNNYSKQIILLGYVSDEEIIALYKNALFFVFPSLEEGFGLPIIEAQFLKCPILCSDIPVFREVAGVGAEFCETDYNSIASKIEYLLNNRQRLNELIELGELNLSRFRRSKIVKQVKDSIV